MPCSSAYFPSFFDIPCAVVLVLLLQIAADPLEDLRLCEGDFIAQDGFQRMAR